MRIYAEPFDHGAAVWEPYDADRLARLGAPEPAIAVLAGRGLPGGEHFVRVPERELEQAELPECGKALFLGHVWDGYHNSYWLGLADGAVWMRYGGPDEPAGRMRIVGTTAESFGAVLGAYLTCAETELDEFSEEFADLIYQATIRAVAADPGVFAGSTAWWGLSFQEIEFLIPRLVLTDTGLTGRVHQDTDGRWYLEHPGYEEEDG